jgi:RNA polymerase sigma factor (TIGR02999 family)
MRDASETPSPTMSSDIGLRTGPSGRGEITELLVEIGRGNEQAREPLFETVYDELRALAHARLRSESRDVTLSTTGLVHEAYLRLMPIERIDWQGRSHFFATAARAMRRILVDRARAARRQKRAGPPAGVSAPGGTGEPVADLVELGADELLALDEALDRLGALHVRQLRVVELRFFAGLSVPETADVLGVAPNTVKRDWSTARAWLNRELAG